LAGVVDDVELLFFESEEASNLPSPVDCSALVALSAEHGLSYTVHLPLDTWLGSEDEAERLASLGRVLRVIERTRDLDPFAYVLHFHGDKGDHRSPVPSTTDIPRWQAQHSRSVEALLSRSGIPAERFAVETLAYDFDYAAPIIEAFGLSVCLDIGHLLLGGRDVDAHIARWHSRMRVVHLHGVREGKDHCSLEHLAATDLARWLERFSEGCDRVVTVEVFSEAAWLESARLLARCGYSEESE
jgi:sugar phosphate isomerase/epimerase